MTAERLERIREECSGDWLICQLADEIERLQRAYTVSCAEAAVWEQLHDMFPHEIGQPQDAARYVVEQVRRLQSENEALRLEHEAATRALAEWLGLEAACGSCSHSYCAWRRAHDAVQLKDGDTAPPVRAARPATRQKGSKMLGEPGTEQFTIRTDVDGKTVDSQHLHDPLVFHTVILLRSRWRRFLDVFRTNPIRVQVCVSTHPWISAAILMLDPVALETEWRQRKSAPYVQDQILVKPVNPAERK